MRKVYTADGGWAGSKPTLALRVAAFLPYPFRASPGARVPHPPRPWGAPPTMPARQSLPAPTTPTTHPARPPLPAPQGVPGTPEAGAAHGVLQRPAGSADARHDGCGHQQHLQRGRTGARGAGPGAGCCAACAHACDAGVVHLCCGPPLLGKGSAASCCCCCSVLAAETLAALLLLQLLLSHRNPACLLPATHTCPEGQKEPSPLPLLAVCCTREQQAN